MFDMIKMVPAFIMTFSLNVSLCNELLLLYSVPSNEYQILQDTSQLLLDDFEVEESHSFYYGLVVEKYRATKSFLPAY